MIKDDEVSPILQGAVAEVSKSSALGWTMVLFFVVLNVFGAFVLKNEIYKLGSWNFSSLRTFLIFFIKFVSSGKIITAMGALFGSTIAWSIALANLELSRAYPVGVGLNFLIIMISSIFFFGECLTIYKLFGGFFVLLGVVFLLK